MLAENLGARRSVSVDFRVSTAVINVPKCTGCIQLEGAKIAALESAPGDAFPFFHNPVPGQPACSVESKPQERRPAKMPSH
jgi:hypothetical protein